jgi:protein-S-isoprenylcysteine O-methyltransferase Ste14
VTRIVYWIRQIISVLFLPVIVTIVVPLWIGARAPVHWSWPSSPPEVLMILAGVLGLFMGLLLFVASLSRFAREGQGTLAPWDPPRRLVISGPYRYVRNPMIASVIIIVAGEALAWRSWALGLWALAFTTINAVYIPLLEEPRLERRFGDEYRRYRSHVRRFVPRAAPWDQQAHPDNKNGQNRV